MSAEAKSLIACFVKRASLRPGSQTATESLGTDTNSRQDTGMRVSPALLKTAKGAVRSALGNRRKTWGQTPIPDKTREFESVPVFLLAVAIVAGTLLAGCGRGPGAGASTPKGLIATWGMAGRIDGAFVQPRVIECMPGGELVVIDRSGRVQFLDAAGKFLSKFTLANTQRGYPTGAAVTPDGRLWIAETHAYRVGVYTPEGRELMAIGGEGKGDGRFVYVTDVAVSPAGDEVYASDFGGPDRVQVFDAAGNYKRTIGRTGSAPGEWKRPQALAVAPDGSIFVADSCNDRIQKISPSGKVLGVYGAAGAGPGQLRYPYDLAIAPDGLVYIAEYGNCRVQRMTQGGQFLGYWGKPGSKPGELAQPWAVTLDRAGRLYILDTNNTRVVVVDPALAEWVGGMGETPRV